MWQLSTKRDKNLLPFKDGQNNSVKICCILVLLSYSREVSVKFSPLCIAAAFKMGQPRPGMLPPPMMPPPGMMPPPMAMPPPGNAQYVEQLA